MASNTIHTNLTRLPKDLTLNVVVHYTRRLRFRMWLARGLAGLAVRVLGCGVNWDEQETPL